MARLHSIRRIAGFLQPSAGLGHHGQPESVSTELSVPRARQLCVALSGAGDSEPARRARRLEAGGDGGGGGGCILGLFALSGARDCSGLRSQEPGWRGGAGRSGAASELEWANGKADGGAAGGHVSLPATSQEDCRASVAWRLAALRSADGAG